MCGCGIRPTQPGGGCAGGPPLGQRACQGANERVRWPTRAREAGVAGHTLWRFLGGRACKIWRCLALDCILVLHGLRPGGNQTGVHNALSCAGLRESARTCIVLHQKRAKGLEPSTFGLGSQRSTAELRPHAPNAAYASTTQNRARQQEARRRNSRQKVDRRS